MTPQGNFSLYKYLKTNFNNKAHTLIITLLKMMKKDNLFLHIKMDKMTHKLHHYISHLTKQQYTRQVHLCYTTMSGAVSIMGRKKARLPK